MDGSLAAGKLKFTLSQDASRIRWEGEGLPTKESPSADFWRLFLDDGELREITVRSSRQKGRAEETSEGLRVVYDRLISDFGKIYPVRLCVFIRKKSDCLEWQAEVTGCAQARVNEIQLPFLDFSVLCDENRENDVYYKPLGLGQRFVNPWEYLKKKHTEYMSADYNQIWDTVVYPARASMCWFGVESGGHFLYVGKHDSRMPVNVLAAGTGPRHSPPRLILSVSHFPLAQSGETVDTAKIAVALSEGDWRTGSALYGDFARKHWYCPPQRPDWLQNMTGWQRIILKHQYGEIFFLYRDLPEIYRQQRRWGLDTLMVFGWWKGRFDNGYPLYEPDPALGGEKELTEAIEKIHSMGGRVILYTNGVLIDVKSDYYKKIGYKICRKDIDGNEYQEHYRFGNNGMTAREFGYKTFVSACQATGEWKNTLLENGKIKLSFHPDSIFYDQIATHFSHLCFDESHLHGARGDREQEWRIENLKAIRKLCGGKIALGSEGTVDCVAPYLDYHHGSMLGNRYKDPDTLFPEMYLATFPDTVQTNRYLHDDKEGFEKALRHAFLYGFRFDVSIYRGRKATISDFPAYGDCLKELLELKERYHRFFYHGVFTAKHKLKLPAGVQYTEFEYEDEVMFAFWNHGESELRFALLQNSVTLKAGGVDCLVVNREQMEKMRAE